MKEGRKPLERMGMEEIQERLKKLRQAMHKAGVYAYYIPTADFHHSEYVNDYFKVREFFSGFTGSAGYLLVTEKDAFLWTDGRYFIQAEKELGGSGIRLCKMDTEGYDSIEDTLKKMPEDAVLGFDGRTVSASLAKSFKKALPSGKLKFKEDLTEKIFIRPKLPQSVIENLPEETAGESAVDKIGRLREHLKENRADAIFISRLDDIAWLLNIRGRDIPCNPVVLAYLYVDMEKTWLFTGDGKTDIAYHGALVRPYQEALRFMKSSSVKGRVMLDPGSVSVIFEKAIKKHAKPVHGKNPTEAFKAVKNPVEIRHLTDIFLKDSLALTRFIRQLTTQDKSFTEMSAADALEAERKKIREYREPSFPTIAAYGPNGAIIHYEPSHEHETTVERKGLFMVDSGGQYLGGTTDVTRTIVMGELTPEEKQAFTDTALGMLDILNAVFLKGTSGMNLDFLARRRFWNKGMDYKHGTGHGVGYMLNVHEGPQAIRMRKAEEELKPGMLVSDEPGLYREGRFGVRTENILLVEEAQRTGDGVFYRFKNLTWVPIDHKGMDLEKMSREELAMYEAYQKETARHLRPHLSPEEFAWLQEYAGIAAGEGE